MNTLEITTAVVVKGRNKFKAAKFEQPAPKFNVGQVVYWLNGCDKYLMPNIYPVTLVQVLMFDMKYLYVVDFPGKNHLLPCSVSEEYLFPSLMEAVKHHYSQLKNAEAKLSHFISEEEENEGKPVCISFSKRDRCEK